MGGRQKPEHVPEAENKQVLKSVVGIAFDYSTVSGSTFRCEYAQPSTRPPGIMKTEVQVASDSSTSKNPSQLDQAELSRPLRVYGTSSRCEHAQSYAIASSFIRGRTSGW